MKKFIILFPALALLSGCEREIELAASDIPSTVSSAFTQRYPDATDVKWIAEKENGKFFFEACFKTGNEKKEVHFDANGAFVEEEQ